MTLDHSSVQPQSGLDEILAEWVLACEKEGSCSVEAFLQRHPSHENELREYLKAWEFFQKLLPEEARPDDQETIHHDQHSSDTIRDPVPGRSLDNYELLEELGDGGTGIVHKAWQKNLRRFVAIKFLREDRCSQEARKRHVQEATILAGFQHPGIVQVHEVDVGENERRPFICLEFMQGGSLADRLRKEGKLRSWVSAELVRKLAIAVQAAHDKGVLHRDLKPANVLLTEEGEPKLSDFGLAKQLNATGLTVTEAILGTPSYMAPEAAMSERATEATDVYGLGAILYECLTGKPPFQGKNLLDTLYLVRESNPEHPRRSNPDVPKDLEAICLKCLEKDPANRYGSAKKLAEDLARHLKGEPVQARPPGWLLVGIARDNVIHRREWAWLCIWSGIAVLLAFATFSWLLLTDRYEKYYLLATVGFWMFAPWSLWWYLWPIRHDLSTTEKHILIVLFGCAISTHVLPALMPGNRSDGRHFPITSLLIAVEFLFLGAMVYGRFYPAAIAFGILALILTPIPNWAPLAMGVLFCIVNFAVGWHLLSRKEEQTSQ